VNMVGGVAVGVVRFDDSWQIGFEIERIDRRKVTLCRDTLRQAVSEAQMPPRDRGEEARQRPSEPAA
jgi:hypothetical protein